MNSSEFIFENPEMSYLSLAFLFVHKNDIIRLAIDKLLPEQAIQDTWHDILLIRWFTQFTTDDYSFICYNEANIIVEAGQNNSVV